MGNNLIASVGFGAIRRVRLPRAKQDNSVAINGSVYGLYNWDSLNRDARQQGTQVAFNGTEIHINDDWSETRYQIFTISKVGTPIKVQVAIEA